MKPETFTLIIAAISFIGGFIFGLYYPKSEKEKPKHIHSTDEPIEKGCPFDDDCYNPNTPYLDNTQMPRECVKCGKWNQEICNTCPIINPQHEPV